VLVCTCTLALLAYVFCALCSGHMYKSEGKNVRYFTQGVFSLSSCGTEWVHARRQGCHTSVSANKVITAHLARHHCFFIMFHFIVTDLNLTHWHWNWTPTVMCRWTEFKWRYNYVTFRILSVTLRVRHIASGAEGLMCLTSAGYFFLRCAIPVVCLNYKVR